MEPKKSNKKYLIALGVLASLIVLVSLGSKSSGDTFDHVFQGLGMVLGGGVITLIAWPFVWLFKRKSEHKWEIAAVIGLTLDLMVVIAQISQ